MFKAYLRSILCVMSIAFTYKNALSLPEDQYQAIDIEADQAFFDEQKGITIYSGNVIFTQGSLELRSEKLTIKQNTQQALESILAEHDANAASVSQVTMKQQILGKDDTKEWVDATADKLSYRMDNKQLELKGNAQIKKGLAIINSDLIIYNANNGIFKAKNPPANTKPGEASPPPSRVRITIPPQTPMNKDTSDWWKLYPPDI